MKLKKMPPHLKHVATLPYEITKFWKKLHKSKHINGKLSARELICDAEISQ